MNGRSFRLVYTVTAVALVCAVSGARAAIDADLVGTWQLQWTGADVIWSIHADGKYEISGVGSIPQQGVANVAGGQWSIQSPVWSDAGTYRLNGDTLLLSGKLGTGTWQRMNGSAPQATSFAIPLVDDPARLPVLPALQALAGEATRWQADAVLERAHYDLAQVRGVRFATLALSFCSPSTGLAYVLHVSPQGTERRQVQPRAWCTATSRGAPDPIPTVFLDLPAAVGIARKEAALTGVVSSAELRVWHPNGIPVLAWSLRAPKWVTVDASSGAVIVEDVTGATEYIAAYNATWEKAAAGLRALLRPPRKSSSASGNDVYIGEDTSDSSSGTSDGSDAAAEYQAEVCRANAYWAPDPGAYERAQSGSTTWSDTSYGCY